MVSPLDAQVFGQGTTSLDQALQSSAHSAQFWGDHFQRVNDEADNYRLKVAQFEEQKKQAAQARRDSWTKLGIGAAAGLAGGALVGPALAGAAVPASAATTAGTTAATTAAEGAANFGLTAVPAASAAATDAAAAAIPTAASTAGSAAIGAGIGAGASGLATPIQPAPDSNIAHGYDVATGTVLPPATNIPPRIAAASQAAGMTPGQYVDAPQPTANIGPDTLSGYEFQRPAAPAAAAPSTIAMPKFQPFAGGNRGMGALQGAGLGLAGALSGQNFLGMAGDVPFKAYDAALHGTNTAINIAKEANPVHDEYLKAETEAARAKGRFYDSRPANASGRVTNFDTARGILNDPSASPDDVEAARQFLRLTPRPINTTPEYQLGPNPDNPSQTNVTVKGRGNPTDLLKGRAAVNDSANALPLPSDQKEWKDGKLYKLAGGKLGVWRAQKGGFEPR